MIIRAIKTTLLFTCFLTSALTAQKNNLVSIELQAYPTGLIPGLGVDLALSGSDYIHLRAGVNLFDHRDLGVQDKEEGIGYGLSVGYRRFIGDEGQGFRWGIKSDVWLNKVDWINTDDQGNELVGETKITVLQPTGELSYVINKGNIVIAPSLAFGMEWNVKTDGEPTGEGPILLIGLQLAKRI